MSAAGFCVFEYLYRDADNFKAWGTLLLKGTLTDVQVAEMRSRLEGEEFFIAEQIGVPPLYQELWAYSGGLTESDHPWHKFFAVRPAEANDFAMGTPWGSANTLFNAITKVATWKEHLSPCWEVACW
jgi:hypothetical protein